MVIDYQTYGVAADGTLVHAGPIQAARFTAKLAAKVQSDWEEWRTGYLKANPSAAGSPLAMSKPVVEMRVHPLGDPKRVKSYPVNRKAKT